MENSMMELDVPNLKIEKWHNQATEINQTVKILYALKQEIISRIEERKNTIRNIRWRKNPSVVIRDRTVSLLDRWVDKRLSNKFIFKMYSSDEVIALMREIRKEFDRSLSLLTLTILNETSFEIPE